MGRLEMGSQDHFKALIDAEFFHSASYKTYQNKPPSHTKDNLQANSFWNDVYNFTFETILLQITFDLWLTMVC